MRPLSFKERLFLSGGLMYSACHSLMEDNMGLEGYLSYVQHNWVSAKITVPIAIVAILISIVLWFWKEKDRP